jgi:hypothetical protein
VKQIKKGGIKMPIKIACFIAMLIAGANTARSFARESTARLLADEVLLLILVHLVRVYF